jgi:hypothetical protein
MLTGWVAMYKCLHGRVRRDELPSESTLGGGFTVARPIRLKRNPPVPYEELQLGKKGN